MMARFEGLEARVARSARRRIEAHCAAIAADLAEQAPGDIGVRREEGGVVMTGRGLVRRFAIDPVLRWIIASTRERAR